MKTRTQQIIKLFILAITIQLSSDLTSTKAGEPTYKQAQTILTKYCAGCHNADESNGEFRLDTFEEMQKGGENGNAFTAGSAVSSRIIQMMRGKLEPVMPPEDEAQPTNDEIQILSDWIDSGANGPDGSDSAPTLPAIPQIDSNVAQKPVTAIAFSKDERFIAIARFGEIKIFNANDVEKEDRQPTSSFRDLKSKINSLQFIKRDRFLIAGMGVAGLYGEAILIDLKTKKIIRRFRGHRDLIYSVAVTHDETMIATASYDRTSVLWNVKSDKPLRTFKGHNDAVFANAFDNTGELLVTASADATVKVWRVRDAERLDTRGEPLKEQYTAAISPDGKYFVAGGEDNRIRKWRLDSRKPNQTNPLSISRFAHESAIQILRFHPDRKHLISVASNGSIKIWDNDTLTQQFLFKTQNSNVQTMAVARERLAVGRMDGSVSFLKWPSSELKGATSITTGESKNQTMYSHPIHFKIADLEKSKLTESEPNDEFDSAMQTVAPFIVSGTIAGESDATTETSDVDLFRFASKSGERWVIETKASQMKSPVDTHIAIYDSNGKPVPRVLLRAIRDSYFTFRGKNSKQSGDFRIHNWEEMKLNQLLYCNGEVVKLYHYPRGPDSGYDIFPGFGNRHAMFDTTPITHALHEPCYVVEAHPPGTKFPATGLPQFLLNFENDDDAEQENGADSKLTFTAPADGDYFVRVRDTRGFQGEKFKYDLIVRPVMPDFQLTSVSANPKIAKGTYKRVEVKIDRKDFFAGPVSIAVENLPKGITVAGPVTIAEEMLRAYFVLHAANDAMIPDDIGASKITATAMINGETVTRSKSLGKISLTEDPKLSVALVNADDEMPIFSRDRRMILEIKPGETITAQVKIRRDGYMGRVNFGKQDAALNLPFGVYVDNTGLNGVLIPEGQTERTFFITAEDWVKPCERLIFLEAGESGKPSSNPVILRVIGK
ncbi:MAG: c-type cytochrome domain-containing protein [Mariniblastus sp.]